MSEVLEPEFSVVDPTFHAPVAADLVDSLIGRYQHDLQRIERIAEILNGEFSGVVGYFIRGNAGDEQLHRSLYLDKLFTLAPAVAQLNATYWSDALKLTDVLDCMPQKRRSEWHEQIRNPMGQKATRLTAWQQEAGQVQKEWFIEPLPDFTEETVRSTLQSLLTMRQSFFSERVDGIFQALSRSHVTNQPEGFSKRMILNHVTNSYGHPEHKTCGYINDLRCVVAKFMGRDEPSWHATDNVVSLARSNSGQWITLDGGALRLRCYKKGTGHLEVHPDMAYRLNVVLAHLYPAAIPSHFRAKPKQKSKEFRPIQRPLPFAILEALQGIKEATEKVSIHERYRAIPNSLQLSHGIDKSIYQEIDSILRSIGGVKVSHYYQFPYYPIPVVNMICATGCLPDVHSHQFYPTPKDVGTIAVEMADIGPNDLVLEPEAGQADLADLLPKARTTCVELSPLHVSILKAKGYTDVHEADFIAWADQTSARFDRVVMNPPFDQGRAKQHAEAAYSLLKPGGILVSVLPAGMRNKPFLDGAAVWSPILHDRFDATSVSVCIMRVVRV